MTRKRILQVLFGVLTVISITECKKDDNSVATAASADAASAEALRAKTSKSSTTTTTSASSAYNIQDALPKGYVKDGSVDYTSYVQAAINKYSNIVFPAFPIAVNDTGLQLVNMSNKTLTFQSGSEIVLPHSSKSSYNILLIYQSSNITLVNPVVVGDRYNHTGTGEWGMGIGIYSSSNVNIISPTVTNCFGDGIYLAASDNLVTNTNVTITNAYCDHNRRNGISVISANGVKIVSPHLTNSNGTLPMAGIDVEPDSNTDEAQNISITNALTENNLGRGIQVGLINLHGANAKQVSISIDQPVDNNSPIGMEIASYKLNSSTNSVSGTISVTKPTWSNNSDISLRATWLREPNLKLTVTNPNIRTSASGAYLSQSAVQAAMKNSFNSSTLYQLVFN